VKKLLLVAAGIFVLFILSIGIFAVGCVVHGARSFSFGLGEKSTRAETHALEIAKGGTLEVDLAGGDVRVKTSEDAPSLSATVTTWAGSREEADKALARAKLEISKNGDGLRVTLVDATTEKEITGGHARSTAQADLEIRVPAGVRLEIKTESGDVEAEGPFAASKVHSSYGSVRIKSVEGELEATSDSGDVSVAGVRGKSFVAKSSYGKVEVVDCESAGIEARSSSGDVRLQDVRGERLRVGSDYGDVRLLRVSGDIEAKLSSGSVHAVGLTGPRASISTDYGEVNVEKASGILEAHSSSGDVRVKGFEGTLQAHSSYGAVDVEGVFAELTLDSSSGDVTARALSGSKIEKGWKLSSSYGSVKLAAAESFACDLDANTEYGAVALGFPIEVAPGVLKKGTQSVKGKLNGGGGVVEIRCTSGDVSVGPLGR
jgi:DUF4097 and DUF4098 domain-containing protein YvlB